jgi:hypothetical protein
MRKCSIIWRSEFGPGTGMQDLNRALTAGSFEDEYPDAD